MSKLVFLDYTFLFDPESTWPHLYEFEKDLSDFFAAYGLQAEIVKTIEGNNSRHILKIERIDKLLQPILKQPKPQPQRTPQEILAKMKEGKY